MGKGKVLDMVITAFYYVKGFIGGLVVGVTEGLRRPKELAELGPKEFAERITNERR